MDVQSITEVNRKWIFSGSAIQDKATPEKLREICAAAMENVKFYDRMQKELSETIDRAREKQSAKHCPTVDEIQKLPPGERFTAEVRREYYLRDSNKISGMYELLADAHKKYFHYQKLARQAKAALGEV